MTDETSTNTEQPVTEKRRGGWPKGKARPATRIPLTAAAVAASAPNALLSSMKARPNWENDDYVGVGQDNVDRLRIPSDLVQSLYHDGVALQWVTKSVRGQETPQELSKMTQGGWTPVHQSDFGGVLDGMFLSKGIDEVITVDDCMLVARPAEIQRKARAAEQREANRPLRIAEEQLGHGVPNVTGSNHPSVRNTVNKTMERIEIPE